MMETQMTDVDEANLGERSSAAQVVCDLLDNFTGRRRAAQRPESIEERPKVAHELSASAV